MTQAGERKTWETTSAQATFALGEVMGRSLVGGLAVGLAGPLGAGKTQLVKGIAAGNAVDDVRKVTSPTFTLIHEYPGRFRLYHVDVYRLGGAAELLALGFDELLQPDTVVVVEWADRVRSAIPSEALWVELTPSGETSRTVAFDATGEAAARCLDGLRAAYR
ncbi:MAG: tRNA (adenosine(37)-N6)-threonylcarbamoyltransferase complex ATPase subunit type 1 TsaE [Phycisphaerales bacterium]|nr:MAG: tRNA (adenosine(37)-N6)-threonylcarbamoyltransferase complex ATPase subunit type 1 TsaE [Phycisphaerales bacterium]